MCVRVYLLHICMDTCIILYTCGHASNVYVCAWLCFCVSECRQVMGLLVMLQYVIKAELVTNTSDATVPSFIDPLNANILIKYNPAPKPTPGTT